VRLLRALRTLRALRALHALPALRALRADFPTRVVVLLCLRTLITMGSYIHACIICGDLVKTHSEPHPGGRNCWIGEFRVGKCLELYISYPLRPPIHVLMLVTGGSHCRCWRP
jgi:hypothetical protein